MVTIKDRVTYLLLDEATAVTPSSMEVWVRTSLALSDLRRGQEAGMGQWQGSRLGPANRSQLPVTRRRGIVARSGGREIASTFLE